MPDRVQVYHPESDNLAVIAAKTLPIRQRKGWVVVDDVALTSSNPDEVTTPPARGDNEPPSTGEESNS